MPDIRGQAFDAGSQKRKGREESRVAVPRDDLGGHGLRPQTESAQGLCFNLRCQVRVGANRAGDLADSNLCTRGLQTLSPAVNFGKMSR